MKVLLEIQDNKATHLLEVLKELPYVKTTPVKDNKTSLSKDIKQSVKELNLIKQATDFSY